MVSGKILKIIIYPFDRLEDKVRGRLSHHPFVYAFFGGSGVILFWRGIWHAADYLQNNTYWGSIVFSSLGSMILGAVILLLSGLFVAVFIGDSIIMSGIRGEKKLVEKTEEEIDRERKLSTETLETLKAKVDIEQQTLDKIEKKLKDINMCEVPEIK